MSTAVPGIPFSYGDGEAPALNPKYAPDIPKGEGATCTVGELAQGAVGFECAGDFEADVQIKPRRVRMGVHRNTVVKGGMPSLVMNARCVFFLCVGVRGSDSFD